MQTNFKEIIDAIASNNARAVFKVLSQFHDWTTFRINQELDSLLHLVVCKFVYSKINIF